MLISQGLRNVILPDGRQLLLTTLERRDLQPPSFTHFFAHRNEIKEKENSRTNYSLPRANIYESGLFEI